jgi:hypothetical protein
LGKEYKWTVQKREEENSEYSNILDKKAKNIPLQPEELNLKQCLDNRLAQLLREEEIKWCQRAIVKELLEGDSNIKYFQLIASGKHRKTRIFQLQHEDKVIEGINN